MAVDARGFDLTGTGQLSRSLGRALSGGAQLQQSELQELQLEKAGRAQQIRDILGGARPSPQQQMLAEQTVGLGEDVTQIPSQSQLIEQARQVDPVLAEQHLQAIGLDSASKRAEASRFASQAQTLPVAQRQQFIQERAQKLQAEGRDPKDTLELLQMTPEQQNQALTGVQLLDLSTKERFGIRTAAAKAIQLGGKEVKSSKILDDGTTVQSMKDGTTQVISPEGASLEGSERATAIKTAQKFGVELQGQRAQQREGGKGAAKIALNAFDRVSKIRSNIDDLREGIRLVNEEGAETGPIAAKLPSFRAGTKRLENLRARLGLNVIGSVTFGALSEGELNLALDTALPQGLNEDEIVKWMEERVAAQQKLSDNLEEAALFLSEPGNTVADFIRFTKQRDKQRKAPAGTQQVGRFTVRVK
jgi:hypothetical protein